MAYPITFMNLINCVESQAKGPSCCRKDCKVFILPDLIFEFPFLRKVAAANCGLAPLVVCSG